MSSDLNSSSSNGSKNNIDFNFDVFKDNINMNTTNMSLNNTECNTDNISNTLNISNLEINIKNKYTPKNNSLYESTIIPKEENSITKILKYFLPVSIFGHSHSNSNISDNSDFDSEKNDSKIIQENKIENIKHYINLLKKGWKIDKKSLKIFDEKQLGSGSSSKVFYGIYKGIPIADKRIDLFNNTNKNVIKEFQREIKILLSISHPYLVFFYGVIIEPKYLSIIMEYCSGGDLYDLLKNKKIDLPWKLRKKILLQIAIGMNFLHSHEPPIIHRDLKSLNILLTNDLSKSSDTNIKIADFGLCREYEENIPMTQRAGTNSWMAPEVISSQIYSTKVDVYSYGIIIWEVCTRKIPYSHLKKNEIFNNVVKYKERPNLKIITPDTPKQLIELMKKCWEHNPNKRPTFKEIINLLQNIYV
jgi:hypothetical protein